MREGRGLTATAARDSPESRRTWARGHGRGVRGHRHVARGLPHPFVPLGASREALELGLVGNGGGRPLYRRRRRFGALEGLGLEGNGVKSHPDANGVDGEGGGELTTTNSTTSSRGSGDGIGEASDGSTRPRAQLIARLDEEDAGGALGHLPAGVGARWPREPRRRAPASLLQARDLREREA